MIRTRFAPSPTGELHIGGARTALFAYLFARHENGEFFIRIEDTDRERYVEGAVDRILESLDWLGIHPDNLSDIMVQSQRKDIYRECALKLVETGHAYVCECSKERLEELRKQQEANHLPPQYDRHCRDAVLAYREGCVIRFKMPREGEIRFTDAVRGEICFDAAVQDDPIIFKSDGFPTYHLAAVVDDHEMGISHVIRGEEWLSSTPKHIALYEAFGWTAPTFAHLPVILGPDKKHKLSKRDGDVSVIDFKKKGYLPEALINFIALLGWNPKTEQEEFTQEQLVKEFSLDKINKSPAVFDIVKLNSINEKYLMDRDPGELANELVLRGLEEPTEGEVALVKRGGYQTLVQAVDYLKQLRKEPEYEADLLVFRKSDKDQTRTGIASAREKLASSDVWSLEELQAKLSEAVAESGLSNGDVFWPVRVALSGEEKSPSPAELAVALGRVESLKRIDAAIVRLK